MVVKKEWLRKKLKRLKKQNMERKSKDINVFVTGVSMEGESEIDDNNRTTGEDKRESSKTYCCYCLKWNKKDMLSPS